MNRRRARSTLSAVRGFGESLIGWLRRLPPLDQDALLYVAAAALAFLTSLFAIDADYRTWGDVAGFAYGIAACAAVIARRVLVRGANSTGLRATRTFLVRKLIVAFVIVIAFSRRSEHESLDFFFLLSSLITLLALLTASDSYNYYYYFSAPFLLGVFAISLARLRPTMKKVIDSARISRAIRLFTSWASIVAGLGLVISLLLYGTTFYSYYMSFWGEKESIIPEISLQIPPGSCVIYLQSISGLLANRFQTDDPKCPNVVDPYGMWMAWGYQLVTPAPAFVKEWKSYFQNAQFVVLGAPYNGQTVNPGAPTSSIIPWNHELKNWFKTNYHLVLDKPGVDIYKNNERT